MGHEKQKSGLSFDAAMQSAVRGVLKEREYDGETDPRLRFVIEYASLGPMLFTPATRDVELALHLHGELEKLRTKGASREEALSLIRTLTIASKTAAEEQQRLVDLLEQHLRSFRRLLRRQECRPEGTNAAFLRRGSTREGSIWAEALCTAAPGNEPVLLCRGPGRKRLDEALA